MVHSLRSFPLNSFIIVIYDFFDRTFNSHVMGFSCVTPQGQLPKKNGNSKLILLFFKQNM